MIVGGGATGCEAAWRAALAGANVTLVTTSLDTVYSIDVEPGMLAPPAGSLLREVLDLGAGTRWDVHRLAKYALEGKDRVHLLQSTVSGVLIGGGEVLGVQTWEGVPRMSASVALCVGTFLKGRLEIGSVVEHQGRLSEMAYDDLHLDLLGHGFEFEDIHIASEAEAGSLPHVVRSVAFSPGEWSEPTLSLQRVTGMYAAGACVARADGPPGVEECVSEGARLGTILAGLGSD